MIVLSFIFEGNDDYKGNSIAVAFYAIVALAQDIE